MSPVDEVRSVLRSRDFLLASGYSDDALASSVRAEKLVRVRRGFFMKSDAWNARRPEAKHLAHVVAAQAARVNRHAVFSHKSAAVLLGLPLIGAAPKRIHISGATHSHPSPDVARHVGELSEGDITEVDGIRCTSLERTAYDLARTLSLPAAVAVCDGALASIEGDPRDFDADAAEAMRERLLVRAMASDRGVRKARFAINFANGRASTPIESLGRIRAYEVGFRDFTLQVPLPDPYGGTYWVDLRLGEAGGLHEFDGFIKLTDERILDGRTPAQAVREEKQREDWIRGVTGERVLHFSWDDVNPAATYRARLAAFGVPLPHRI